MLYKKRLKKLALLSSVAIALSGIAGAQGYTFDGYDTDGAEKALATAFKDAKIVNSGLSSKEKEDIKSNKSSDTSNSSKAKADPNAKDGFEDGGVSNNSTFDDATQSNIENTANEQAAANINTQTVKEEMEATYDENLAIVGNATTNPNHFGIAGVIYGITGKTNASKQNNTTVFESNSMSKQNIEYEDSVIGGNRIDDYRMFGQAVQQLINKGQNASKVSMLMAQMEGTIDKTITAFTKLGWTLLTEYNLAPVVLSAYDNTNWTTQNKIINLLDNIPVIKDIIIYLGTHHNGIPNGVRWVILGSVAYALFAVLIKITFNKDYRLGETFRSLIINILIASAGIPLFFSFWNGFMGMIEQANSTDQATVNSRIISENLNFYDWYMEKQFALPEGMSLRIKDGRFVFSTQQVEELNRFIAKNVGIDPNNDEAIAKRILTLVDTDKNRFATGFTPAVKASKDGGSQEWATSKLYDLANLVGNGKQVTQEDVTKIGYINAGQLEIARTGENSGQVYMGSVAGATTRGMSPIAAYSILMTNFTNNSMTTKPGLTSATGIPKVITGVTVIGSNSTKKTTGFLRMIIQITLISTAITSLIKIITASATSAVTGEIGVMSKGSTAGLGKVIGSIIGFTIGMLGMGIAVSLGLMLADLTWQIVSDIVYNVITGVDKDGKLNNEFVSIIGGMNLPGWLSWLEHLIVKVLESISTLIVYASVGWTLPYIARIPIKGFTAYLVALPDAIADKFLSVEREIVTGYSQGESNGSQASAAAKDAARQAEHEANAKGKENSKNAGSGLSIAAGYATQKLANKALEKLGMKDQEAAENGNSLAENNNEAEVPDIPDSHIGKDVKDADGNTIGTVGEDGKQVLDKNGNTIGTVDEKGQFSPTNADNQTEAAVDGSNAHNQLLSEKPNPGAGSVVTDSDGNYVGTVSQDGQTVTNKGQTVGQVDQNGNITDENGKTLGNINDAPLSTTNKNAGKTIYDDNNKAIGTVDSKGNVRDNNGQIIGSVNNNGQAVSKTGQSLGSTQQLSSQGGRTLNQDTSTNPLSGMQVSRNGESIGTVQDTGTVTNADGRTVGQIDDQGNFIPNESFSGMPNQTTIPGVNDAYTIAPQPQAQQTPETKQASQPLTQQANQPTQSARQIDQSTSGQAPLSSQPLSQQNSQAPNSQLQALAGKTATHHSGKPIGQIQADGSVIDNNGNRVGSVDKNGYVRNNNNQILGRAPKLSLNERINQKANDLKASVKDMPRRKLEELANGPKITGKQAMAGITTAVAASVGFDTTEGVGAHYLERQRHAADRDARARYGDQAKQAMGNAQREKNYGGYSAQEQFQRQEQRKQSEIEHRRQVRDRIQQEQDILEQLRQERLEQKQRRNRVLNGEDD